MDNDLKLPILILLNARIRDRCHQHLLYAVLGMEPRASYIVYKPSTKLAWSQPVVSVYIVVSSLF